MDMAVGIIIGGAFTSIVSSLVDDIINPILGLFGGMNFDQLKMNLLGEVTLNYGNQMPTLYLKAGRGYWDLIYEREAASQSLKETIDKASCSGSIP